MADHRSEQSSTPRGVTRRASLAIGAAAFGAAIGVTTSADAAPKTDVLKRGRTAGKFQRDSIKITRTPTSQQKFRR